MTLLRPARARYSKIEQLTHRILERNHITSAPVPIEKIVRETNISVKKADLGDVSGLLVRSDGEVLIGLNSSDALVRQRFTLAHEFAHYLLHDGISAHYDRDFRVAYRSEESSQATNVEEIEANFFAASILMPRDFLEADGAIDQIDDDAGVAALAKRYHVSRHAMSLRLANVYQTFKPF